MGRFAQFAARHDHNLGVTGVTGVTAFNKPNISAIFSGGEGVTPARAEGVAGVTEFGQVTPLVTPVTPSKIGEMAKGVTEKYSNNNDLMPEVTPVTPVTPFFDNGHRYIDPAIDLQGWIDATNEKVEAGVRAMKAAALAEDEEGAP